MSDETFAATPAEQLLLWMSEVGHGTWRRFKEAHNWVFRGHPREWQPQPSSTAQHLLERGHAEFDWREQRWTIAPTVLTTVPGLPSAAIVVGGRTRATLQAWTDLDWPDVYLQPNDEPPAPPAFPGALAARDGVRSIFVVAEHVQWLQRAADEMHATFTWDTGLVLAERLPRLTDEVVSAPRLPPPPESDTHIFVPRTGRWASVSSTVKPGLYRFRPRRIPTTEFRLLTEHGTVKVERSIGIYAALAQAGMDALWYQPADVNGQLYVRASAPLPALHARALHLCSGLRPDDTHLDGVGATRRYENIPLHVAEAVATSLSQSLGQAVPA